MGLKLKFHKFLIIGLLFCLTHHNANCQYSGTNLRGQIQYYNQYYNRYFPLSGAVVDLYYCPAPNQYILVTQTMTSEYGFYYFYAIRPGNFYIQVNRIRNYQITVIMIRYFNNQYNYNQFQDIPILYF